MNHRSLSSRESVVLTSSPLRRKSMLNLSTSDSSLRQNDDDAERMERRRNAEMEMRQRDITPPASEKRKSLGGSIAGLSAAQLAEHYANCIKLSAENKINTKNAFSLQLIDYMAMMLKKRDSKMDNFQVASCTLDASTKIYAYRVDCVHTDVLKMAGGLAAGYRKKQTDADEGEGREDGPNADDDEAEEVRPKRKTRRHKNTVATNVESLNGKLDLQHALDPFFLRAAGSMGDCQPGDSHFLTSLKTLSNCALNLCSELPYWDTGEDYLVPDQLKVQLPFIPDLKDKIICPVFSQFSFTTWSLDTEEQNDISAQAPHLPPTDDDFAFDVNAVPEPVPADCENEAPMDHFEVSGIDEGLDSEGEDATGPPIACRANQRTPAANVVDLRKHLSIAPSEYSYFRAGSLDLWAGPSHWKIRPVKSLDRNGNSGTTAETGEDGSEVVVACRKQKQKQKKELIVDFNNDYTLLREKNIQVLKLTKRTMQKVWSGDKNTHPPDIHFDIKCFSRLEMRKLAAVNVNPAPYEDDQPSGYDYENDHDTSEYCPNVALNDDGDDGDDAAVDDDIPIHQDVHNSIAVEGNTQLEAFAGDNLVAPPSKVARIFIPYAMRAKKVDMKKLKNAIWDILTDADKHKDRETTDDVRVERPVGFREMYIALPGRLSSQLAENLSAPLAIVALLHLANEKTLHIVGKEDLSDLVITQG